MLLSHLSRLLEGYLHRHNSLTEVEGWLLLNLQTILDSNNQETIAFANQVDADLVELRERLLDEAMLRERFKRYLTLHPALLEYTQATPNVKFVFSSNPSTCYVISQETAPWLESSSILHQVVQ